MKKTGKIIITIAVILVLAAGGYMFVIPNIMPEEPQQNVELNIAYVTKVSDLISGFSFTSNRYSGAVENQEIVSIEADSEKKIKTTFVKEGDEVKTGDKLFEYDIEDMQLQLDQNRLDLEQKVSEIKSYNDQISSLEKEKKNASTNKKLTISNQIEAVKLELKQAEYTKSTIEKTIEKLQKSIKNNIVKSSVGGIVQSVNDPASDSYIKIASNGDYRIKAIVSEENISDFFLDEAIIIRSRTNNDVVWTGKVTSIDTAKPLTDNNMYSGVTTTKYPVYISLDSSDGLLIGQHVTVEMDKDAEVETSRLMIDAFYIVDADSDPYIWAESSSNLLEKRKVELGVYDSVLMKYEMISGIT